MNDLVVEWDWSKERTHGNLPSPFHAQIPSGFDTLTYGSSLWAAVLSSIARLLVAQGRTLPKLPEPTDSDLCRECYAWKPFPEGQRHFGYSWWRQCDHGCNHAHHREEMWIA